jgi:hypothetical protein
MGKIYSGRTLSIKTRQELLSTIKPGHRRCPAGCGDVPPDWDTPDAASRENANLRLKAAGA